MNLPIEDRCTPRQAARLIGCHISLIYRCIMRGRLRAWRIASARYILHRADVLGLVEELKRRAG